MAPSATAQHKANTPDHLADTLPEENKTLNNKKPRIAYSTKWTTLSKSNSVSISGIEPGGIEDRAKITTI
jgi:hypothetical protein